MKWGVRPKVTFSWGLESRKEWCHSHQKKFWLWKHFEKNSDKFWWEWHHYFLLSSWKGPTPHFIALTYLIQIDYFWMNYIDNCFLFIYRLAHHYKECHNHLWIWIKLQNHLWKKELWMPSKLESPEFSTCLKWNREVMILILDGL